MAVVTALRPDDRSGQAFLQILCFLRERHAAEPNTVHGSAPTLHWVTDEPDAEGEPERSATAQFGGFRLLVVDVGDTFLVGKPLFLPRVSWCLGWGPEQDDVMVGGPAPTFEEAKARAELALRVKVRAAMDS